MKKITLFLALAITASIANNSMLYTAIDIQNEIDVPSLGTDEIVNAIAIQSDGKIITAGYSIIGGAHYFSLARCSSDGSLDITFNNTGKIITPIGTDDIANAVAIQSDGKIVAAGYSKIERTYYFTLVRYNNDGSLDASFGSHGKVSTLIGINDVANAVAIQSDGKIVAAGYTIIEGTYYFVLARYNSDGSLDASFGSHGKVITNFDGIYLAYATALHPDGSIIVAGTSDNNFALVRYLSDGSLDTTFGSNGIVTTNLDSTSVARAIALQPDNKIVTAGITFDTPFGTQCLSLARYNADGSLDNTFGTNGISITHAFVFDIWAILTQSDNNCFIARDNGSNLVLAQCLIS